MRSSGILYKLSLINVMDPIVRWGFDHFASLLPVRKLVSSDTIIAFKHPRPSWDIHFLLVPKRGLRGFLWLTEDSVQYFADILEEAQSLADTWSLNRSDITLMVNGGKYQDVGQLHFHLLAGDDIPHYSCSVPVTIEQALPWEGLQVCIPVNPARKVHYALRLTNNGSGALPSHDLLTEILTVVANLVRRDGLMEAGFSVVICGDHGKLNFSCMHLVSGAKI